MAFVLILTQIPNISVMAFEKNAKIGNADIKSEDLSSILTALEEALFFMI